MGLKYLNQFAKFVSTEEKPLDSGGLSKFSSSCAEYLNGERYEPILASRDSALVPPDMDKVASMLQTNLGSNNEKGLGCTHPVTRKL